MNKAKQLLDLINEAKAIAIKDADFGIHGFVHKGDTVKVARSGPDHYLLDLGKSRFDHPRALATSKLSAAQFKNHFKLDEPNKKPEDEMKSIRKISSSGTDMLVTSVPDAAAKNHTGKIVDPGYMPK